MSSLRRSVSDRFNVSSTASARSSSSSNCSTGKSKSVQRQNCGLIAVLWNDVGGSQRYNGGAAKLDFSFSSSGEDEGIPMDEFDDDAIQPIPTSSTVSRLFATPLSEKANKQFSGHDESFDRMSDSPAGLIIRMPDLSKLSDSTEKSCRPQLRRAWSMYENTTPNSRVSDKRRSVFSWGYQSQCPSFPMELYSRLPALLVAVPRWTHHLLAGCSPCTMKTPVPAPLLLWDSTWPGYG